MQDQPGAPGLVLNCLTLCNTVYLDSALARQRTEGYPVLQTDAIRLSSYMRRHINVHWHHSFQQPETAGSQRELRDPTPTTTTRTCDHAARDPAVGHRKIN